MDCNDFDLESHLLICTVIMPIPLDVKQESAMLRDPNT